MSRSGGLVAGPEALRGAAGLLTVRRRASSVLVRVASVRGASRVMPDRSAAARGVTWRIGREAASRLGSLHASEAGGASAMSQSIVHALQLYGSKSRAASQYLAASVYLACFIAIRASCVYAWLVYMSCGDTSDALALVPGAALRFAPPCCIVYANASCASL